MFYFFGVFCGEVVEFGEVVVEVVEFPVVFAGCDDRPTAGGIAGAVRL